MTECYAMQRRVNWPRGYWKNGYMRVYNSEMFENTITIKLAIKNQTMYIYFQMTFI